VSLYVLQQPELYQAKIVLITMNVTSVHQVQTGYIMSSRM